MDAKTRNTSHGAGLNHGHAPSHKGVDDVFFVGFGTYIACVMRGIEFGWGVHVGDKGIHLDMPSRLPASLTVGKAIRVWMYLGRVAATANLI